MLGEDCKEARVLVGRDAEVLRGVAALGVRVEADEARVVFKIAVPVVSRHPKANGEEPGQDMREV